MRKKIIITLSLASLLLISFINVELNSSKKTNAVNLTNIEALAAGESPEWWDFFNNHEVEERFSVTTSQRLAGSITIKGVTVSISSTMYYSQVVYHNCYDGGTRDECTSSHVHCYI